MNYQTNDLKPSIISIGDLLGDTTLRIPSYQRPYKWTTKHVGQLFSDIMTFKDKSSYRLGTIVFHQDGEIKNIVDGQQRVLTLLLSIQALVNYKLNDLKRIDLQEQLNKLKSCIINPEFSNDISKFNLHNNYLEISRIIKRADFNEEHIDFFLNQCKVVTFYLNDISEAFQFFDSQNSRGKDLEPHDLLKAYHLREFKSDDDSVKSKTVETWEHSETSELAYLFSKYLYRVRNWTRGKSARYFGKDDIHIFKGVNIESIEPYPYVKHLRITHNFVDQYNNNYERKIDGYTMDFPFHLDQTIINGRRFFEMTSHYQKKIIEITNNKRLTEQATSILDDKAKEILKTIDTYEGCYRTGDRYVRCMFDCLLIFYIDKFGFAELSTAIKKIFIWAYSLRLKMQVMQLATMDNYAFKEQNLFKLLKDSIQPSDFINCSLPVVTNKRSTKTEKIEVIFKEMNYYE